jgi:hypothetical protein
MRAMETKTKYHSKTTYCWSKHKHDSMKEAEYCNMLLALQRAGDIRSYEIQKEYALVVNSQHICKHRVDFVVTTKHGAPEIHEVKGFATAEWNIKRKLFEALYPDLEYIIIR